MNRTGLQALLAVLLLAVASGCGDTVCKCVSDCSSTTQYCWDGPDGPVCFSSPDAFPWNSLNDTGTWPEDALPGEDGIEPAELPAREDMGDTEDLSQSPDETAGETAVDVPPLPWDGSGELRSIWVTRWDYGSAGDIETIMDNIASWGLNAVFFQVRGVADAYYDSAYEPWAKGLSGTLGQDPGWDPLAVAVEAAHERNLQIHAWINTFTAWSGNSPPPACNPPHILTDHPEWLVVDSNGDTIAYNDSYVFVSPGIPGVRQHITNVAVDLVTSYDVDGLHFDYIRYPGPQYSHDDWTESAYNEAVQLDPGITFGDFQRQQLTTFVAGAYQALTEARDDVVVSASVWGIYTDEFGWGGTSEGYPDYYQDSHGWMAAGILDAICPMIYWPLTNPKGGSTDWATLADHHQSAANGRHVYLGLKGDYDDFGEIADEIAYGREIGAAGYAIFAYSSILSNGHGGSLASQVNAPPTLLPGRPWK